MKCQNQKEKMGLNTTYNNDKKYGQNIGGKKGNYMNSFSLQNDKKNKNGKRKSRTTQ